MNRRCWVRCRDSFSDNRKSAIENPKLVGLLAIAVTVVLCGAVAQAQQPGKIPWIGYLAGAGSGPSPAFIQGLRDLGYVEGKNIAVVFRTVEGKSERFADLAAELVRLKVDIIVTDNSDAALAFKKATSTIPIVMTRSTDPVGSGLIASFARPGGNVTGLTSVTGELGGKLLELLKEIVPRLTRVAILMPEGSAVNDIFQKEAEVPARALGVQLIPVMVRGPEDFEGAFRAMTKEKANGLVMRLPSSLYSAHLKRVAELTMKNRLPSISNVASWVDAGGLMSYGSDLNVQYRRAAVYVDKILKGAKPANLPVEAPTKFELRINLKTAKQIDLTIPSNVLGRADRVIK
jgi:putative tryptophan/tyrosine transport system substrate-binding protein